MSHNTTFEKITTQELIFFLPLTGWKKNNEATAFQWQNEQNECHSLVHLRRVLVLLTAGKLGPERASLGDDRLHGDQLVDEILHIARNHSYARWKCCVVKGI